MSPKKMAADEVYIEGTTVKRFRGCDFKMKKNDFSVRTRRTTVSLESIFVFIETQFVIFVTEGLCK